MKIKNLLFYSIFLLFLGFYGKVLWAQESTFSEHQLKHILDAPTKYLEQYQQMLKNPVTGEIPENIQAQELEYARSSTAKLQTKYYPQTQRSHAVLGTTAWEKRGPYNIGGRTRALAIDQTNENIILAGGVSGGLWRSIDGGTTWTKVTNTSHLHSVTTISQDPLNPNVWYYGTGELEGNSTGAEGTPYRGDGIFKSTDNGVTWTQLSSTSADPTVFTGGFQYNHTIKINPTNSDIYAATHGGIQCSKDGGSTWTLVLDGGGTRYTDISISSTGVMYATLSGNGSAKGIFRSIDGTAWIDITPLDFPSSYDKIALDIAPSNENVVYFFANTPGLGVNDHSLYKYTYSVGEGNEEGTEGNGGNWENRTSNLPAYGGDVGNLSQGSYSQYIKVKPDEEEVVFLGSSNLYRSTDGFATGDNHTWIGGYSPKNNISSYPNHYPYNHALVFLPSDPKIMITGHDGGLSKTLDNLAENSAEEPVAWTFLNNGYYTTLSYSVGIDPETANDARMLAGFQDNGKWYTNTTSATVPWQREIGGRDGTFVAMIPGQDIRYMGTSGGAIARIEGDNPKNPTNYDHVHPAGASGQLVINPFVLDKNDYNIMYYPSGNSIWRHNAVSSIETGWNWTGTDDTGWANLSGSDVGGSVISALAISKIPAHVLYYGTTDGKVYKLLDANLGNPAASEITGVDFPVGGYVNCIAVNPANADEVFVVFSNYGIKSIFYSIDGGSNWTDVSGNLEENTDGSGSGPSVRWLEVHVASGGQTIYYVGTSTGLYATETLNGTSTTWIQEGENTIGNIVVPMIQSRGTDGLVAVATHGNGLYSAHVGAALTILEFTPSENKLDETVILTGTGFTSTPVVKFNGVLATVSSFSQGEIITTVPIGATTGKITIEVDGEEVTSVDDFIVIPPIDIYPYEESFESSLDTYTWKQVASEEAEWNNNQGNTTSQDTGPSKALNGNQYLYIEATEHLNETAILKSDFFDLTSLNTPVFNFAYHLYGETMGELTLEVSTDYGATWNVLWEERRNQGNSWQVESINLTSYKTEHTQFRFVGITGDGDQSDIAIDDIRINDNDTEIIQLIPEDGIVGTQVTILKSGLSLENPVVKFNGIEANIVTTTKNEIIITVPENATTGKVTLEAEGNTVESPEDFTVFSLITSFPDIESFETGFGNWIQKTNEEDEINWIRQTGKTPTKNTGPDGAHEGTYYTYIEASSNAKKTAVLNSPYFDFSLMTTPLIQFSYNMYGENIGKLELQYSLDDGQTWFKSGWLIEGDQGEGWKTIRLIASPVKENIIRFRFVGTVGTNWLSDIAIDAFGVGDVGHQITGFSPERGLTGQTITIEGTGFDAVQSNNIVKFNGIEAKVISSSTTQLVVRVPQEVATGKITVEIDGEYATSINNFEVLFPSITGFTPKSGVLGTEVTITGTNFSSFLPENTILFNGVKATVKAVTATELVAVVPANASSGKISIQVADAVMESADTFVIPATIAKVNPAIGLEESEVVITGTNFNVIPSENMVRFNGVQAEVVSASSTKLTVKVPTGSSTGKITLEIQGNIITSAEDFTVILSPVVAAFSPEKGYEGLSVTITGKNFSSIPEENTVRFNGRIKATVLEATSTKLLVVVPQWASTGKISVETQDLSSSSETDFVIEASPLGLGEKLIQTLSVYPNPTSGIFDVSLKMHTPKPILARLYHSSGVLMATQEMEHSIEGLHARFYRETLPVGTFIIRVEVDGYTLEKKVVIE